VRFLDSEKEDIIEDFLFCRVVDTTGEVISKTVLKILMDNQIPLNQCSKITTDYRGSKWCCCKNYETGAKL